MITSQHGISSLAIKAARDAWINAVQARDIEAVVQLYDPTAGRLLGTLDDASTEDRATPARILDYFRMFLAQDRIEVNIPAQVFEKDIQRFGPDHAAYHGYYDFRLTREGKTQTARAKFTFIYRRADDDPDRLLIVAHNSGLTPHGIA